MVNYRWTNKEPTESGWYWYIDNERDHLDIEQEPTIAYIDAFPEAKLVDITSQDWEESYAWEDRLEFDPRVSGPLEMPDSPYLTEGLHNDSFEGKEWAWEP